MFKNIINELELIFHIQNNHSNIPFSITEILEDFSNCNSKNPSSDDIPYTFIKNIPNIGLIQHLQIYNLI